jgi:hypothetical protein
MLQEIVVDALLSGWRGRHRRWAVYDSVRLRDAMVRTLSAWNAYLDVIARDESDDHEDVDGFRAEQPEQQALDAWGYELLGLTEIYLDLGKQFEIFAPEALERARSCIGGDIYWWQMAAEAAAAAGGADPDNTVESFDVGLRELGLDVQAGDEEREWQTPPAALTDSFRASMDALDSFIRETFTIEEVSRAQATLPRSFRTI